jgi:hypothetical protein
MAWLDDKLQSVISGLVGSDKASVHARMNPVDYAQLSTSLQESIVVMVDGKILPGKVYLTVMKENDVLRHTAYLYDEVMDL